MKIPFDVISALSTLEYPLPTQARLVGQLDRATYARVDKTLRALGGAWDRRAKAHVFPGDARVRVDEAIITGEVETARDLGFFETPPSLVARLVEMAGVKRGMRVLEPSAGTGRIVTVLQGAGARVTACEWDDDRRIELARCVLTPPSKLMPELMPERDFLDASPDENDFGAVVMNPPFTRVGKGDHLDHVRHAYGMLAAGGSLVSVLPASVVFRRDRRHTEFREWCEARSFIDTFEALPSGSFAASGTSVETIVVRLVKPREKKSHGR